MKRFRDVRNSAESSIRTVWVYGSNFDRTCTHHFSCGQDMVEFSAYENLVAEILGEVKESYPQLLTKYKPMLEITCPRLFPSNKDDAFLKTDAITFAIIRRISRETVYIAKIIDQASRFLYEYVKSAGRDIHIACRDSYFLDRPSARVFYRFLKLLTDRESLQFTFYFQTDPFLVNREGGFYENRLQLSRQSLFKKLLYDLQPEIRHEDEVSDASFVRRWLDETVNSFPSHTVDLSDKDTWLRLLAKDLVYHNYDKAYLSAAVCMNFAEDDPDLFRLTGIVDVNVGSVDHALASMELALERAQSPSLKAHIHYLRGLLFTKRKYDLDQAENEYNKGLAIVANSDNYTDRFEEAWLYNGIALLKSLRSRNSGQEDKQKLFDEAMDLELQALNIVVHSTDSASTYLQFNLFANIVFLFEINKQYDDAIKYWKLAFEPYLGQDEFNLTFEKVYAYRLGLLCWKNGQREDALAHLKKARQLAQGEADHFNLERILYGLGYCLHHAGHFEQASDIFEEGMEVSYLLRDENAYLCHAIGRLAAKRAGGEYSEADLLMGELSQMMNSHLIDQNMVQKFKTWKTETPEADLAAILPFPSPKLPSYIPAIDLESVPDIDLNRYLVVKEQYRNKKSG